MKYLCVIANAICFGRDPCKTIHKEESHSASIQHNISSLYMDVYVSQCETRPWIIPAVVRLLYFLKLDIRMLFDFTCLTYIYQCVYKYTPPMVLGTFFENWIEPVAIEVPCIRFSFPTGIICRVVSGVVTGCLCVVSCRGLTVNSQYI